MISTQPPPLTPTRLDELLKAADRVEKPDNRSTIGGYVYVLPEEIRAIAAELRAHRERVRGFEAEAEALFKVLEHGDEKHRQWLRDTFMPHALASFARIDRQAREECAGIAEARALKWATPSPEQDSPEAERMNEADSIAAAIRGACGETR